MVKATYTRKINGRTESFGGYLKIVGSNKTADKVGLHAITESETNTQEVSQYAIEAPNNAITDHVRRTSKIINLTIRLDEGTMAKTDALYKKLQTWSRQGKEVEYRGASMHLDHCVMSNIGKSAEKYVSAMDLTIELTYVYFAKTSVITHKAAKKKKGKKVVKKPKKKAKKKSKAVYRRTKRGDTYWGFHMQVGTSIAQLRKWNKYPDRRIPIGVKLRIK